MPEMTESCKSYVERYIPSFDVVWEKVRHLDRWEDYAKELYGDVCKEKDVDPKKKNEELMEEAWRRAKDGGKSMYDHMFNVLRNLFGKSEFATLYRSIWVDEVDLFIGQLRGSGRSCFLGETRGVGVFWVYGSWEGAEGYWSKGDDEVILEATVRCDDVDFTGMLVAHLTYSGGGLYESAGEEFEVTLKPGREIRLDAIYKSEDEEEGGKVMPGEEVRVPMGFPIWT